MEVVYHQTSLRAALSILDSGQIFGRDGYAVPNFSRIEGDRRNLLEGQGIELKFAWSGKVSRTYHMDDLQADTLYDQSALSIGWNYWRSFLLPGSMTALIAIGAKVTSAIGDDSAERDLERLEEFIAAGTSVMPVHPSQFVGGARLKQRRRPFGFFGWPCLSS